MAEPVQERRSSTLTPEQVQGRKLLEEHLLSKGADKAQVAFFLGAIDTGAVRAKIYGQAANSQFVAGEQAFATATKKTAAALADISESRVETQVGAALGQGPNQSAQPTLPRAQLPASGSPATVSPATVSPATGPQSATISFNRSVKGSNSVTVHREELRLTADGSLEIKSVDAAGTVSWKSADSPDSKTRVTCLYANGGKLFTREGKEVTTLDWGSTRTNAGGATAYFTALAAGQVSGVRDGFLKDMRYNDSQVVLTQGPPPGASTLASSGTAKDVSSPQTSSTARTESRSEQQASLPQTARSSETDASRQAIPQRSVSFALLATNASSCSSVQRDLRLSPDGRLEMRFVDAKNQSVWLEPNDRANGVHCSCLFHHEGKFYTGQGTEVKQVTWGGKSFSAACLPQYLEQMEAGKVSSVKPGYLNDVQLDGKRLVFTEGLPPVLRDRASTPGAGTDSAVVTETKTAPSQTGTGQIGVGQTGVGQTGVTAKPNSATTAPSLANSISISVRQSGGSYHAADLSFRRSAGGDLEIRNGSGEWKTSADLTPTVGKQNVDFELLYHKDGKLFDRSGAEVESLQYAETTVSKANFNSAIMCYTAQRSDGAVYGMQNGYLNDIRRNGRQVVFVNAPPPGNE